MKRLLFFLIACAVLGGSAWAQSPVFKTNSTAGSFDASSGTRTFGVTAADMAGGTAVNSVTIAIDFEKYDGETFGVNGGGTPFYNEIFFSLTNPQGVTTTLISAGSFQSGSGGFRGVIAFDDLASSLVNVNLATPQAGTFRPTGPGTMSSLISGNGVGTWTLSIQDTVGSDQLGFYSASLNLNNASTSAAPEPGSLALLGLLGLPLLRFVRRRRTL